MPRVSQNHDGSPKRRLQPIFLLDEPLGCIHIIQRHGSSEHTVPQFASVLEYPSDFSHTVKCERIRMKPGFEPGFFIFVPM